MKLAITAILFLITIISNGQNNQLPDPFETIEEENYRLNNPHLVKPDSNYLTYWCSIEILTRTQSNFDSLGLSGIANFLATFHPSCKHSVEFTEWSNELLFKVFLKYPTLTLQLITKNNSFYRNQILEELNNPIHDQIDLDRLIVKLESIKDLSSLRTRNIILKELKSR